jgi:hypothetical protein
MEAEIEPIELMAQNLLSSKAIDLEHRHICHRAKPFHVVRCFAYQITTEPIKQVPAAEKIK